MKLLAPLASIDYYEYLSESGADEFFMGYVPARWYRKYVGSALGLNRREQMVNWGNAGDTATRV